MYQNSTFDGSAAFSGRGFMPSQATETSDTSFPPAKSGEAHGLLPLTVKQISEAFQASDDKANFLIDGVDVNRVKLVGLLCEKTERVTDVAFVLDDGTGRIDCHIWINEPLVSAEMESILDGMYVKVQGHLQGFQGKKQLMIYYMRRIIDYNENLLIVCTSTATTLEHGYGELIDSLSKMQGAPQVTGQMPNSAVNTPSNGYQPTPSDHFSVQYNKEGAKGLDKLILEYLQQPSCVGQAKGIHRAEIGRQLNVPEHKIIEVMDVLESEGLVYSTIDDLHFRSTANG